MSDASGEALREIVFDAMDLDWQEMAPESVKSLPPEQQSVIRTAFRLGWVAGARASLGRLQHEPKSGATP